MHLTKILKMWYVFCCGSCGYESSEHFRKKEYITLVSVRELFKELYVSLSISNIVGYYLKDLYIYNVSNVQQINIFMSSMKQIQKFHAANRKYS